MRKIFVLFSVLYFSNTLHAQKLTKDSLIKLMSIDVCIELNKIIDEKKQITSLETELGMSMLPAYSKYLTEIKEIYGFDDLSSSVGEVIGRDIGVQLAKTCPAFLQILRSNSDATAELLDGRKNSKTNSSVEGTLQKIVSNEFNLLEIKTNTSKIEKLYWFEYFEGSNTLVNEPSKMLNKLVKVTFKEKEIFKPTLKDYIKIKVITGIELN